MQIKKALLLGIVYFLMGCTKHEYFHGYSFDPKEIEKIQLHKTTEDELLQLLGYPTSTYIFGDKAFFYISMHQESKAFFLPHIVTQEVLEVTFDNHDIVKDIKTYTLDDARNIEYASDTTKLRGNELTPIEQILTNVGKFNTPKPKQY